jgi:hypothetical protein
MRAPNSVPKEALKLTDALKTRLKAHLSAYGPRQRMSETQALEPYRWASRFVVGVAGVSPQISCPGGLIQVANELAALMQQHGAEILPVGFILKTTPFQKLENKLSKFSRGGGQGKLVNISPWEGKLPTPLLVLQAAGKVRVVDNPHGRHKTMPRMPALAEQGDEPPPPPRAIDPHLQAEGEAGIEGGLPPPNTNPNINPNTGTEEGVAEAGGGETDGPGEGGGVVAGGGETDGPGEGGGVVAGGGESDGISDAGADLEGLGGAPPSKKRKKKASSTTEGQGIPHLTDHPEWDQIAKVLSEAPFDKNNKKAGVFLMHYFPPSDGAVPSHEDWYLGKIVKVGYRELWLGGWRA